jgi:hypothetical protein
MSDPVCSGFFECLFKFQAGLAGVFAVIAAIITATMVYRAAHLPIRAAERRVKEENGRYIRLTSLELSGALQLIAKRARMGQATVRVHKASNASVTEETRQKMRLPVPAMTKDWEFMSLIPEDVARECTELNSLIEDHNFDVERAGGAFGDDNFGRSIIDRLSNISGLAERLASKFSSGATSWGK